MLQDRLDFDVLTLPRDHEQHRRCSCATATAQSVPAQIVHFLFGRRVLAATDNEFLVALW